MNLKKSLRKPVKVVDGLKGVDNDMLTRAYNLIYKECAKTPMLGQASADQREVIAGNIFDELISEDKVRRGEGKDNRQGMCDLALYDPNNANGASFDTYVKYLVNQALKHYSSDSGRVDVQGYTDKDGEEYSEDEALSQEGGLYEDEDEDTPEPDYWDCLEDPNAMERAYEKYSQMSGHERRDKRREVSELDPNSKVRKFYEELDKYHKAGGGEMQKACEALGGVEVKQSKKRIPGGRGFLTQIVFDSPEDAKRALPKAKELDLKNFTLKGQHSNTISFIPNSSQA